MTTLDTAVDEARERLARRAFDGGLARVAVDVLDSPLGPLWLALGPRGVLGVHFGDEPEEVEVRRIVARYGPGLLRAPKRLDPLKRELDEYFRGKRRRFDVPVDLTPLTPFQRSILNVTKRVPFGEVSTYREVAARARSPHAYRAAGGALGANPVAIVVPCHRVLAAGNKPGGFSANGGVVTKLKMLEIEGALVNHTPSLFD